MDQEETPSEAKITHLRKASSHDLETLTIDERFEQAIKTINTKIEFHREDLKSLVLLYQQALEITISYSENGSQDALKQKPILENMLALKLNESTQDASILDKIESIRKCCLLLKSSHAAGYVYAKENLANALIEKSMLINKLIDEAPNMSLPQCTQFQEEMMQDLKESKKMSKDFSVAIGTLPMVCTLLGQTLLATGQF